MMRKEEKMVILDQLEKRAQVFLFLDFFFFF